SRSPRTTRTDLTPRHPSLERKGEVSTAAADRGAPFPSRASSTSRPSPASRRRLRTESPLTFSGKGEVSAGAPDRGAPFPPREGGWGVRFAAPMDLATFRQLLTAEGRDALSLAEA